MTSIPPGLHPVPTAFGCCHVLVESGRAVVLDSGLFGVRKRFAALFDRLGLSPRAVEAIILTHGHLDHAGNAAWLRDWTGAPILAHPAEQPHLNGAYPYRGAARLCGWLEAAGRAVRRYQPVTIDRPLREDEVLPWWGGLKVVHLPGHTAGHCGFWNESRRLLFCGDLVAIWRWWSQFPPFYFNTEGALLRPSLQRALALKPELVVPNHCSPSAPFDPLHFAARFRRFGERKLGTQRTQR